ncbi:MULTISPECIES: hypothetical protein [Shinella]|uniref:Uncharacterized protein n=1 Tax=Shinella sumterensis TaxID=1967501 RepID=A0AA50CR87_9HYPH|nr:MULTISPECIES: hypothetical protein [Shinella]MDC7259498.1 hypothetical protein [Shinella sp. YE25]WLS00611.1 hypothetical protein Q9313_24885 [Shinella sumterensis]CAI0341270.1 conserved hypothetical protein [Rhizobiaceae bacterium]CAK7260911.1 conserved protein of unknown function [Shinella sp. WSC3-e]
MPLLIAEVPEQSLKGALKALAPFVPPENLKLFSALAPPEDESDDELTQLAQKVVEAVRPKPTQPLRKEALRKLLGGHDTFTNQGGEADPVLRNAMGAISKALRTVFAHDQAVRRLAIPKKTQFPDGTYRGTVYSVTPLGARVRDLLKAEKAI